MTLTPRLDLRGGHDCWDDDATPQVAADALPAATDVAIVGAGVTGAILADRLAAAGRSVTLIDRRPPATGSTGASTALVLWAPDVPLVRHISRFGATGAAARWRAVFEAVAELDARVRTLGFDCGWLARPDVYLAGDVLDAEGLRREADARQAAGLPSRWMDGADLKRTFGVAASAAVLSQGAWTVDPVALTRGLLRHVQTLGARVVFPADVTALHEDHDGVRLDVAGRGLLQARQVVLATGYEAGGNLGPGFALGSSFAIASSPGQAAAWRERAMIWEASDPYLYFRTTPDGRLVVGGEDEAFADPQRRDAMIPQKARRLAEKARARLNLPDFAVDRAWAATFGSSDDGLPAIGLRPGARRTFLAHSFGGNGLAFAALAAGILQQALSGAPHALTTAFAPDRFAPRGSEASSREDFS